MSLRESLEALIAAGKSEFGESDRALFAKFKEALNQGQVRAAEKSSDDSWKVNAWVKQGILLGFRLGKLVDMSTPDGTLKFFDKDTYPLQDLTLESAIRIVPGGSSIRDGAYVAPSVVCMPPMYINVGSYVDEGTMIDSHALVGSCAQIGKRVHISAAAQIGGVIEPIGAMPVIIEDDVLVGGNCGVYEGVIVRQWAVLAAGTIITGSTPIFDLVRETVYRRSAEGSLEIPAGAVVVPGSRAIQSELGRAWGLSLYAPVIVKYRDDKTDASTQLEDILR